MTSGTTRCGEIEGTPERHLAYRSLSGVLPLARWFLRSGDLRKSTAALLRARGREQARWSLAPSRSRPVIQHVRILGGYLYGKRAESKRKRFDQTIRAVRRGPCAGSDSTGTRRTASTVATTRGSNEAHRQRQAEQRRVGESVRRWSVERRTAGTGGSQEQRPPARVHQSLSHDADGSRPRYERARHLRILPGKNAVDAGAPQGSDGVSDDRAEPPGGLWR